MEVHMQGLKFFLLRDIGVWLLDNIYPESYRSLCVCGI
jgi:hypothetical protein